MSHEATRTGAPMMFLHLLRWIRENTDISFEILLLAGGPLREEFAAVAPTTSVEARGRGGFSYLESGMARAGMPEASDRLKVYRSRRNLRHLTGFDAVYLNSATSALALRVLHEVPPLVFSHIHELSSAFGYWFPEADRSRMLEATDWYVACADVVKQTLVDEYAISNHQVSRHYEFIVAPTPDPVRTAEFRSSLGIPDDALVVGGAGAITWRKGPDLFLQAAALLRRRHPDLDLHFVWVGGVDDDRMPLEADAAKLGLTGRMHLVGELADPAHAFGAYDVFCLTSREDPYPLVMLETAALAIPVVSFANGGVVEFAGAVGDHAQRRAAVVPYLDLDALVTEMATLLEDPAARRTLGQRAQRYTLDAHTVDVGARTLTADLLRHLGHPHRASYLDAARPINPPAPPTLALRRPRSPARR